MLRLARVTPATIDVLRELRIADGATWGLRIVGATGRPAGSVYPILARLEEGGWVQSRWDEDPGRGPRRRLYELTDAGLAAAAVVLEEFETRATSVGRRAVRARPAAGLA